jgi:hypothetical protein
MDKILQFETDPHAGMEALRYNLGRALRIEPSRMDTMVALDNKEREEERIRTGRKKPGPKPKPIS